MRAGLVWCADASPRFAIQRNCTKCHRPWADRCKTCALGAGAFQLQVPPWPRTNSAAMAKPKTGAPLRPALKRLNRCSCALWRQAGAGVGDLDDQPCHPRAHSDFAGLPLGHDGLAGIAHKVGRSPGTAVRDRRALHGRGYLGKTQVRLVRKRSLSSRRQRLAQRQPATGRAGFFGFAKGQRAFAQMHRTGDGVHQLGRKRATTGSSLHLDAVGEQVAPRSGYCANHG